MNMFIGSVVLLLNLKISLFHKLSLRNSKLVILSFYWGCFYKVFLLGIDLSVGEWRISCSPSQHPVNEEVAILMD